MKVNIMAQAAIAGESAVRRREQLSTGSSTARWPSGCRGGSDPARAVPLMAADLGLVQQGFGDCVEAVQEPMALGFGDSEAILGGGQVGSMQRQGPGLEVDGDLCAAGPPAGRGDVFPLVLWKLDGEQAVVVGVAFEDISKSRILPRGDHGPVAGLADGPDGVFAARAAAEVATDHKDARPFELGVVQGEVRRAGAVSLGVVDRWRAAGRVASVGKKQRSIAGALDPLEIPRWNDEVGIHVGPVEYGNPAAVGDKRIH